MFKKILDFILRLIFSKEDIVDPNQKEKAWEPIDYRGKLTTNPDPTRVWHVRNLNNLKWLVVHQAGGPGSMEQIAHYHATPSPNNHLSKKGAPGIAYHYAVERDGTVYWTNDDKYLTWHVANRNTWSIGILIVGDFNGGAHEGTSTPTAAQLKSLPKILNYLHSKYPQTVVVGHCEIATKAHPKPYCPGDVLMEKVKKYRS